MKTILNAVVVTMFCAGWAMAQAGRPITLKVGDPVPSLAGARWIKGEPVRAFERGKIYVIEMWATWCGPCVAAIPHVSRIQAEYAKDGLIVIGQNVWEDNASAVEPFLAKMGKEMDYRVVMDDLSGGGRGKMAELWMDAAGQSGIPCSFVIGRDGRLAWIGHPMAMEPVLKQIIAGTFNPQKAAAEQAAMERLERDVQSAMNSRQWDRALSVLDNFRGKLDPGSMQDRVDAVRFTVLLHKKDYDAAWTLGADLARKFNDDPNMLNDMAWTIADEPGLEKRDLDLAEKMAVRAVELTRSESPDILDTLARVHFEKGRIDQAIQVQTDAVNKAPADMKQMLQRTLDKYRDAKVSPR